MWGGIGGGCFWGRREGGGAGGPAGAMNRAPTGGKARREELAGGGARIGVTAGWDAARCARALTGRRTWPAVQVVWAVCAAPPRELHGSVAATVGVIVPAL